MDTDTGPATPLIGRAAETDLVRAFASESRTRGGALVLSGEGGVGKTALLDVAVHAADGDGTLVVRAAGVEYLADLDHVVLRQVLRPLRPALARLDPAHRSALDGLGSAAGPPAHTLLVLHAALALLRTAAADRPVLLVVDDLEWVDDPSSLALAFVARRLGDCRVGLLAAVRDGRAGVVDRSGLPEQEVTPLDDAAAARLLGDRFPRLAPRVARRVLDDARGNPLALLELPAVLDDAQRGGLRPLPAVLPPGPRLRTLYAHAIGGLPGAARRPLLVSAIEGTGDLTAVAAAAGGQVPDDLAPAERAGLVSVDRGARRVLFRHPLVRCAVVDAATDSERRAVHRALADGPVRGHGRLVSHLAEGAIGPDARLADLAERGGRRALRVGDAVGAVDALLLAADLGPAGQEQARRLAEAAVVGASITGGLRAVRPLLVEAGHRDPGARASLPVAVAAAWLLLHGDGNVVDAERLLVKAVDEERRRPGLDGRALEGALSVAFEIGRRGGRHDVWRGLLAGRPLGDPPSSHPRLLMEIVSEPAAVSSADGARLDDAARASWREEDPTRIVALSEAALAMDRVAPCRAALGRVVAHGREGAATTTAVRALLVLSVDAFHTGRWDECLQLTAEGVDLCAVDGLRLLSAELRLVRALVAAARGDRDGALAVAAEIAGWAAARGNRAATNGAHRVSALVALADDDLDRAYHHASTVSSPGDLAGQDASALSAAIDLVEAARGSGRREGAARHANALRRAPLAALSPRLAMIATGSQAVAASPDASAAGLFEEALAVPDGERWAFDQARIRLAYGGHLRRHREIAPARWHLGAALATFRRLSADPWTARTREELRAVGSRPAAAPRPRPSLTWEEHQVASLAASGLTNKEIGRRLRISHRTVSARLYRAFPKLGVTSRAGLRDALEERATPSDRHGP